MGKIVLIVSFLTLVLWADSEAHSMHSLENTCLSCHAQQQIPNGLIYRRYLMKYSTDGRMEEAIFSYLKNPSKKTSIMPPQFFLKFPMKEKLDLDDKTLRVNIQKYLQKYDIRKHIIIEE